MDRFEQDRDTLNEWIQLNDGEKSVLIDRLNGREFVDLEDIRIHKKEIKFLCDRVENHFKEFFDWNTRCINNWISGKNQPKTFMGLSSRFKK